MKTATTATTTEQQFPILATPPPLLSLSTHQEETITETNEEVISHFLLFSKITCHEEAMPQINEEVFSHPIFFSKNKIIWNNKSIDQCCKRKEIKCIISYYNLGTSSRYNNKSR